MIHGLALPMGWNAALRCDLTALDIGESADRIRHSLFSATVATIRAGLWHARFPSCWAGLWLFAGWPLWFFKVPF
jgi:hypothetical protein